MTTHQPPQFPYAAMHHALPKYPLTGPASFGREFDGEAFVSDREQSDREVRADALDAAVKLVAALDGDVSGVTERDVLLVADTFAHYIASGVVPPSPRPVPGAGLNLPLKLDDSGEPERAA